MIVFKYLMTRFVRTLTGFLLLALPLLAPVPSAFAAAPNPDCRVVSAETNAWISKGDPASKTTLKQGDPIPAGAVLSILPGRSLVVSLDAQNQNLLECSPQSEIRIDALTAETQNFNLKRGVVTVSLDSLDPKRDFRITTPVAIAAARGTHFQVRATPQATQVLAYGGVVHVHAKDAQGNPMREFTKLTKGQKVSCGQLGTPLSSLENLSEAESQEMRAFLQKCQTLRQPSNVSKNAVKKPAQKSADVSVQSHMEF